MEQSEILLISITKHLFFSWCNIIFIKVSGKTTKKTQDVIFYHFELVWLGGCSSLKLLAQL